MKKFIVIIENKNYRTKSHTSINAYNAWNRNWQIVDKQMIFELCYIEAIVKNNLQGVFDLKNEKIMCSPCISVEYQIFPNTLNDNAIAFKPKSVIRTYM